MASIRKTVLTPVKWVSRKILHGTLLRFPGGDSHDPVACTYCPELCRFSCPTTVASGNDAVTPRYKNSLLDKVRKWPDRVTQPMWPLYDCTGCGRCTEYCVYGMPVADHLFEARRRFAWEKARGVADTIGEDLDPAGDLAEELGDVETASARLKRFVERERSGASGGVVRVREPKVLFYLRKKGVEAELTGWEDRMARDVGELQGRRWLLAESVWLSRRLDRAAEVRRTVEAWQEWGIEGVWPFQNGKDCIDSGGEGAYRYLFPEQAAQMARDFWERDRHRADGIMCWSERSVRHFRESLGEDVPVKVCI